MSEVKIESLFLQVNDHKAHYLKAGEGLPVLLLHGGASDSQDWINTMTSLSSCCRFYALDLAGYGRSDRLRDGYRMSDFVEFTLEFIRTLELAPCVLVGHSLGGRVCLEIALQHAEEVRGLILVDTVGFSKFSGFGNVLVTIAWAVRKLLRRPQPYPRLLEDDNGDFNWICMDRLSSLKPPVLMVWNRIDPYLSLRGAIRAAKLLPDSRLEIFQGYGHAPHKKDNYRFNSIVLDFIQAEISTSESCINPGEH